MIIDHLYGSFQLEPVLEELLTSPPVQRLKKVHQGGANFLVNKRWNNTRYEHSVGVMLLIRKLGGGLPEQTAGLLHDVSHTAFSHVADYVFRYAAEDFHEKSFEQIVRQSAIPAILAKHALDLEDILHTAWPLLEQPLPLLCADRIDYTLRDLHHTGVITLQEAQQFVSDLVVADNQIVLRQLASAEWFTQIYFRLVFEYFQHPLSLHVNNLLSMALRKAYTTGSIAEEDFFLDDFTLLVKLLQQDNQLVQQLLQAIAEGAPAETIIHYTQKQRVIDPPVLVAGKVVQASALSAVVAKEISRAKQLYSNVVP
ncbi:MAG: HD domain-containing protein [Hymenobacteraceae bacterium]|nr:HD domain-containing protein [Hymenobacteraceae bacterium]